MYRERPLNCNVTLFDESRKLLLDMSTEPTRTMVDLATKLAFLRRGEAYPERPPRVDVVETHMSCVFLTTKSAYKLKKPIRQESLDFTTLERRQHDCAEEVRLNRRLAEHVYLGTVPLTLEASGSLALNGGGVIVDWLVHMRRLPPDKMLDVLMARRPVQQRDVREAADALGSFYVRAPGLSVPGQTIRARLERGLQSDLLTLARPEFGLDCRRAERVVRRQLGFLREHSETFDTRAESGLVVEGHGDLRPEHICIAQPPAIIDCLEFSEELRQLDPADEMAFLCLECDRLGQPRVGRWFVEAYTRATGDTPPAELVGFYRDYRALRRATIAVWRLEDPTLSDPVRYASKARRYLELTAPI